MTEGASEPTQLETHRCCNSSSPPKNDELITLANRSSPFSLSYPATLESVATPTTNTHKTVHNFLRRSVPSRRSSATADDACDGAYCPWAFLNTQPFSHWHMRADQGHVVEGALPRPSTTRRRAIFLRTFFPGRLHPLTCVRDDFLGELHTLFSTDTCVSVSLLRHRGWCTQW